MQLQVYKRKTSFVEVHNHNVKQRNLGINDCPIMRNMNYSKYESERREKAAVLNDKGGM